MLCYFEEQKCAVEISNFKDRYFKRLDNDDDKLPASRVELKILTRFVKLVFKCAIRYTCNFQMYKRTQFLSVAKSLLTCK